MFPHEKTDCTYIRHRTGACLATANNNRRPHPHWTTWVDNTFRMTQNITFTLNRSERSPPPSRPIKTNHEAPSSTKNRVRCCSGKRTWSASTPCGRRNTSGVSATRGRVETTHTEGYHPGQHAAGVLPPTHDRRRPPRHHQPPRGKKSVSSDDLHHTRA